MKDSWILGINAYHGDAAACLLRNGELIAAVEEERFNRVKHWAGFPKESIKYCLQKGNIDLDALEIIAINSNPRANLFKKFIYLLKKKPNLKIILDRFQNQRARQSLLQDMESAFSTKVFTGVIKKIEHHNAHLSSAYFASPFEKAWVVSVDGFGDFASSAWGIGNGNEIKLIGRIFYPHSLGAFYQAITQFLGFPNYGDEYKVMGLAPYGKPSYLKEMQQLVSLQNNGEFKLNLKFFRFHQEKIEYTWKDGSPVVGKLYSDSLVKLLGPERNAKEKLTERHMDIAASAQVMYEKALFSLLNKLYEMAPLENLAFAGGCAMNSVANGKIKENSPFKNIYIPSAAGDAGGAVGAALAAWHEKARNNERILMDHAYYGPSFTNQEIEELFNKYKETFNKDNYLIHFIEEEDKLCDRTTDAIIEGKVIGWFNGRMEWGPRALGNRSILGDPRRSDMKDILNLKIKRRESFRPFAPSILREEVLSWFELEDNVPFMMQVFKIRMEKQAFIPAVTHVDGSGRLQTVHKETNPLYYKLISKFYEKTSVPMVLNTSFNENEPIVCKPEEALQCFLRTKMDMLVLENWVIERK